MRSPLSSPDSSVASGGGNNSQRSNGAETMAENVANAVAPVAAPAPVKKRKAPSLPNTKTLPPPHTPSHHFQENEDIDSMMSPMVAGMALDNDDGSLTNYNASSFNSDASDDAPCSDSDDVTGSDEEYYPNDEEVDEDIDYPELRDVLEQEMIADCDLAIEDLGHDNVNDDEEEAEEEKLCGLNRAVSEASDLFTLMKDCCFRRNYQHRRRSESDLKTMKGLMKKIVEFIVFTERLDISQYETAAELKGVLNEKRDEIGKAMADALVAKGHGVLVSKINLGSKFSIMTLILFYLHYAPEGCVAVDGDKRNYCHPRQCCIHTMFTKLYNFLVNEDKYGVDKMKEWAWGGRREEDVSNHMAAVDLIPFLLQKMGNDSEMRKQYQQVASYFGLDSYLDLMIIPFCITQLHIKLFEKQQEGVRQEADPEGELEEPAQQLQLHFCGAASSLHILGATNGVQRYGERLITPSMQVTVGPHPQVWLTGLIKNRSVFPEEKAKIIAESIVSIYSCLYDFPQDFQSEITNIFGGESCGIDLPMYCRVAKKCRDVGLLQLDEHVESDSSDDKVAVVSSVVAAYGLGDDVSTFIIREMETASLKLVMDRIRNCSLSGMYSHVAKKCRDAGLLQLDEHVESDSRDDKVAVVSSVLAAYGLGDDVSSFIIRQMKTASLKLVMDRIRNCSLFGLKTTLASRFYGIADDNSGGDSVAIRNDNDFKMFCQIASLQPDQAITELVVIAKRYKETFWGNFKKLEYYTVINPEHFECVGGERILTIDESGGKWNSLNIWVKAMSGYSNAYKYNTGATYGIMAFRHTGSAEKKVLEDLGVCFDPAKFKEAMEQRVAKLVRAGQDPSGRKSNIVSNYTW